MSDLSRVRRQGVYVRQQGAGAGDSCVSVALWLRAVDDRVEQCCALSRLCCAHRLNRQRTVPVHSRQSRRPQYTPLIVVNPFGVHNDAVARGHGEQPACNDLLMTAAQAPPPCSCAISRCVLSFARLIYDPFTIDPPNIARADQQNVSE